ncbi:hypothetical protein Tco_0234146, partial [Tanacetum coccineum]
MAPMMTTHNVGQRAATTQGGKTSEQAGQRGKRTGDPAGRRSGQTIKQGGGQGSQGGGQGNRANGDGGEVPEFATIIAQQLQNLLPTIVAQVANHVINQGNNGNQDDNVIKENTQDNVRIFNMKNSQ